MQSPDNDGNKVKLQVIRDNNNNKVKSWVIPPENARNKVKPQVIRCNNNKKPWVIPRTYRIKLVKTEENGQGLIVPIKAKYNPNHKVMAKEYTWILHVEEDEWFVNGWFCFQFIEPTKSNPKVKRKASKKTEI